MRLRAEAGRPVRMNLSSLELMMVSTKVLAVKWQWVVRVMICETWELSWHWMYEMRGSKESRLTPIFDLR